MNDDPEETSFVDVTSLRGWGALFYHWRPLLPMFLSRLVALGISPWFGKSDKIGMSTCYVESMWPYRFCARRASQHLCQIKVTE